MGKMRVMRVMRERYVCEIDENNRITPINSSGAPQKGAPATFDVGR